MTKEKERTEDSKGWNSCTALHRLSTLVWTYKISFSELSRHRLKSLKPMPSFLYLIGQEKGELMLSASKSPHPEVQRGDRLKIGEGIIGWVVQEKKPVAIEREVSGDPRFVPFSCLSEDRYHTFLRVPFSVGTKSSGSSTPSIDNLIATAILQLFSCLLSQVKSGGDWLCPSSGRNRP